MARALMTDADVERGVRVRVVPRAPAAAAQPCADPQGESLAADFTLVSSFLINSVANLKKKKTCRKGTLPNLDERGRQRQDLRKF